MKPENTGSEDFLLTSLSSDYLEYSDCVKGHFTQPKLKNISQHIKYDVVRGLCVVEAMVMLLVLASWPSYSSNTSQATLMC